MEDVGGVSSSHLPHVHFALPQIQFLLHRDCIRLEMAFGIFFCGSDLVRMQLESVTRWQYTYISAACFLYRAPTPRSFWQQWQLQHQTPKTQRSWGERQTVWVMKASLQPGTTAKLPCLNLIWTTVVLPALEVSQPPVPHCYCETYIARVKSSHDKCGIFLRVVIVCNIE